MTDAAAAPCEHRNKGASQRSDLDKYVYCRDCGRVLHAHL